jgi:hypothetical protein
MPGITLAQAQQRLDQYLAAEEAVLGGQRVEFNGRLLQRADLESIRKGVEVWNQRVQQLSRRASGRSVAVVPRPSW